MIDAERIVKLILDIFILCIPSYRSMSAYDRLSSLHASILACRVALDRMEREAASLIEVRFLIFLL